MVAFLGNTCCSRIQAAHSDPCQAQETHTACTDAFWIKRHAFTAAPPTFLRKTETSFKTHLPPLTLFPDYRPTLKLTPPPIKVSFHSSHSPPPPRTVLRLSANPQIDPPSTNKVAPPPRTLNPSPSYCLQTSLIFETGSSEIRA